MTSMIDPAGSEHADGPPRVDRRRFVREVVGGSVLASLIRPSGASEAAQGAASDLIRRENQRPGATDWQLTRVRPDSAGYRSPWIEGYGSRQSVKAGESI